jgi:hypothetical protein
MMHPFEYYPRTYTPMSGYSSQVSTPAMTPPLAPGMLDQMMGHQPSWMQQHAVPQELILQRISELQTQQHQLVQSLVMKQQGFSPMKQYSPYVPTYVAPPSPAPPVAVMNSGGVTFNEAMLAAQTVLASVAPQNMTDESVLARAVVAAANALVSRSGHLKGSPQVVVPQAMRSQTPAWIHHCESSEMSSLGGAGLVFSHYKVSESPAPSEGSPGVSKSSSPLADVLSCLNKDLDRPPVFGVGEPKSPGTVLKCSRVCDD